MATVSKRTWTYNGVERQAWVVRYVDDKGVRRSKQFDQKKSADAYKRKAERETEDGLHVAPADAATVRAVCVEYLDQAEARFSDGRIGINRLISLRHTVRSRVIPFLGSIRLADLTSERIEAWYGQLQTERGLGVRTAKDTVYDLRLIEQFGYRRGYTKKTVVTDALMDLRGTTKSVVRTFYKEQVAHLLAVAGTRGDNFKARSSAMMNCMVHLAAFCGLRYGEIMALSLDCLDIEGRMIRVRHSLLFNDDLKGPKTAAGVRDVPMPALVRDLIAAWLEQWFVENSRGLLFRTPKGTVVSQANFHRQWTYLLDRAGLKDDGENFHFHALRHFCASWMIENNLPVTDVAALLGHSKFDMTLQVYAHPVVRPAMRLETMERMAAALPARLSDARAPQAPESRTKTIAAF